MCASRQLPVPTRIRCCCFAKARQRSAQSRDLSSARSGARLPERSVTRLCANSGLAKNAGRSHRRKRFVDRRPCSLSESDSRHQQHARIRACPRSQNRELGLIDFLALLIPVSSTFPAPAPSAHPLPRPPALSRRPMAGSQAKSSAAGSCGPWFLCDCAAAANRQSPRSCR